MNTYMGNEHLLKKEIVNLTGVRSNYLSENIGGRTPHSGVPLPVDDKSDWRMTFCVVV